MKMQKSPFDKGRRYCSNPLGIKGMADKRL